MFVTVSSSCLMFRGFSMKEENPAFMASIRSWGMELAEIATIGTMVVLVSSAHAGARALRAAWLDQYGDAAAGALIVSVGAAMAVLGL